MKWEIATMKAMVNLYCRYNHEKLQTPCADCTEMISYAVYKLNHCPWGDKKSACKNCNIHCYDHEHRERIRKIMRFSGPRMLIYQPILAIRYLLVNLRKSPSKKLKQQRT